MFSSVFLKTLRDQRMPAIAWGIGLGLIVMLNAVGWAHSYPDAASRQRLAALVESGGLSSVAVLFGEPHNLDQLSGWVEWRGLGLLRIIVSIVAVLTAAGITRGSEEAGTVESVLAASSSRTRVFLEQTAAALASLALTCAAVWLFVVASPAAAGEAGFSVARSSLEVLDLFLAAAFAASLTVIIGQFTTSRRSAALAGGGLAIAMHIWNNLCAITPSLKDLRAISPFYLTSRSTPLANNHVDLASLAGLALLALAAIGLSAWLLGRRDYNGAVSLPGRRPYRSDAIVEVTSRDFRQSLGLRSALLHGLEQSMTPILAWGLGLALFCGLMTGITPSLRDAYLQSSGPLRNVLGGQTITDSTLISFLVFSFMQLFTSFYVVTLAAAWAGEELDGRLEIELASPVPRTSFFLQRLAASVIAAILVIALAGAGMYVAAATVNVHLSKVDALVALVLLAPFSAVIVSFSYCVSSLKPQLVVGVASAVVLASYLLDLLVPLFDWPNSVRSISVFYLYGTPLTDGIDWSSTAALIALAAGFAAAGAVLYRRRDIVR